MASSTDPVLVPVAIDSLRPTQMSVGYLEVLRKRKAWKDQRDAGRFLGQHMIPALLGPGGKPWIVDNHHLARALHDEGVEKVLIRIVADLRKLTKRSFRTFIDNRGWVHPYDAEGRRRPLSAIPRHVADLADDPYRSLAGALRRAGGYAKVDTLYAEFLWADYLRGEIALKTVTGDFAAALEQAMRAARSKHAIYLPGALSIER